MAPTSTMPTPQQRARWLNGLAYAIARADGVTDFDLRCARLIQGVYLNRETGDAWPSQDTLAKELGVTVRTVRSSISRLAHAEFLTLQPRAHKGVNVLMLNLARARSDPRLVPPDRQDSSSDDDRETGKFLPVFDGGGGAYDSTVCQDTGNLVLGEQAKSRAFHRQEFASDSIEGTLLEDSMEVRRQRFALIGVPDSILESLMQKALSIWNEMRRRIGADPLYVLKDSHRKLLLPFLLDKGLNAWSAVVAEIESDPGLNGEMFDPPNPVRLGKALLRSQGLLERAINEERYTQPPPLPSNDDDAALT